jgi:hypothetical protein
VSDEACPFCKAPFDPSFRASPAPVPPAVRLSRAALVAFGTGTLSLTAACGGTTVPIPATTVDAGPDTGVVVPYDAGEDAGNYALPYGLGIPSDAGISEDTGTTEPVDAAFDANNIQPPYGAPPYGLPPGP